MMTRTRGFWALLTDEERASFTRESAQRDFTPGQTIIRRLDTERWVAVLLSGYVRVLAWEGGRERVIAIRQPGDIVGELALIDRQPRSATIEAATAVRTITLTSAQVNRVTERHPRVMRVLLAVVTDRLREADRRRIEFTADLTKRFASLLVEYVEQYGRPISRGVFVPITSQADLASIVGASRESLARVLHTLRGLGLLSTRRGSVIVHDLARLRDIARAP